MNALLINHLIGFSLISVTLPSIAVLVYFKRPKSLLNQTFALYCLTIAWWAFFTIFMVVSRSAEWGLFWDRMCLTGVVFIPSTLFHFVTAYTKDSEKSAPVKILAVLNYLVSILFLGILWFTRLFVADVRPRFGMNYFTVPGPAYLFFVLFFIACVILAMTYLWHFSRTVPHTKIRKQATLLFWFSIVGYTGGSCNYLLVYNITLPGVAETSNYGVLVLSLSIAYIIFRYHFLDIEVIIKKTLVFAGLFGFVIGTVSSVVYFLNAIVGQFIGMSSTVSTAIGIVIAMLLYDSVKRLLVRATDRYLFQKKEDIKQILRRLSETIITILDLDQVAKTILETFKETLRAETGVLLLKNETEYHTLHSYGLGWKEAHQTYPADDPLLAYLKTHPGVLRLEPEEAAGRVPTLVLSRMSALQAVVAVPLFLHGELIGVVALGKKKSDQEYGQDEIEYFPTAASQVAIALSNARLYHESILARKRIEEMQLELIHREKMAFVADLVKGLAHEIFNPLLPVFHTLEALERDTLVGLYQVFKAEKASLQPQSRQDYFKHLQDLNTGLETLRDSTKHIHLVIDTLEKMQKEDKETIGPFDFKTFLKDSGALIGVELHGGTRQVATREDVPRGLPPVKGNPTLLAQVFVNLYKNAIHAMEGSLERKITIKAEVDTQDPGFLKIDFSDTGSGIPADILPKIFDFGFTTKGEKGQGIGLSQCKLIIEKFGGTIVCMSQVGLGTTFTIKLPIWEEDKNDQNLNRR